ncbi:hypothetical protein GSQ22_05655 [Clostridioides difficile]|nr:hypothetical protein [Clostridioides difficile]
MDVYSFWNDTLAQDAVKIRIVMQYPYKLEFVEEKCKWMYIVFGMTLWHKMLLR